MLNDSRRVGQVGVGVENLRGIVRTLRFPSGGCSGSPSSLSRPVGARVWHPGAGHQLGVTGWSQLPGGHLDDLA